MRALITSGTLALFAGSALAGTDPSRGFLFEQFDCGTIFFGPHSLGMFDDETRSFGFDVTPNPSFLIGIRITFEYAEVDEFNNPVPDPTSWASHIGVTVEFDGTGPTFGFGGSARNLGAIAGGYSLAAALAAVDYYDIWDFDGSVSDESGTYTHLYLFEDPLEIPKPELITIRATDTWNGNVAYRGFRAEILKAIPAPGSAALLAFGGLVLARRRR